MNNIVFIVHEIYKYHYGSRVIMNSIIGKHGRLLTGEDKEEHLLHINATILNPTLLTREIKWRYTDLVNFMQGGPTTPMAVMESEFYRFTQWYPSDANWAEVLKTNLITEITTIK